LQNNHGSADVQETQSGTPYVARHEYDGKKFLGDRSLLIQDKTGIAVGALSWVISLSTTTSMYNNTSRPCSRS
jgi:hypothetical protein